MPTTLFMDAEGRVVAEHAGQLTADALTVQITELLL